MPLLAVLAGCPAASAKEEESKAANAAVNEYLELAPAFIANYGGPGPVHFLKADITLRLAKDAQAAEQVKHHMPYLRHVLLMLLSRQTEEAIGSMEGKEKLRAEALAAVQAVLQAEAGKPLVDDLLFTNFVVQR